MAKFIVIIDDDSEDIEFLKHAILKADPTTNCIGFTSSQEAVQAIYINKIVPDVICVDYNMPVLNGVECLRLFNTLRMLNQTSLIATSSYLSPTVESEFRNEGASYVFEKPNSMSGYQRVVEHILNEVAA